MWTGTIAPCNPTVFLCWCLFSPPHPTSDCRIKIKEPKANRATKQRRFEMQQWWQVAIVLALFCFSQLSHTDVRRTRLIFYYFYLFFLSPSSSLELNIKTPRRNKNFSSGNCSDSRLESHEKIVEYHIKATAQIMNWFKPGSGWTRPLCCLLKHTSNPRPRGQI